MRLPKLPKGGLAAARKSFGEGLQETRKRLRPALGSALETARQALLVTGRAVVLAARRIAATVRVGIRRASRATARAVEACSRVASPQRVMLGVTLAAAALLAASQFADYSGIRIGTGDYAHVGLEAPAPVVSQSQAGSAHAWVLVPLAIVAGAAAIVAAGGRWRVARIASLVGLAGIAIALIVDRPSGLDTGSAGIQYSGAKATLLSGFWAEIAASAVLVLCGLLLARWLAVGAKKPRRRRSRATPPASLRPAEGRG